MRLAVPLLALCTLCSGCALIDDASRNFCVALKTPIEQHREIARNKEWAEQAWGAECARPGADHSSADYADGFKAGFAEYLYRGGDGQPPLVAPLRYRRVEYQTSEGYQAIQDWFAGYRRGAAVARDSGARRWITGPSSLAGNPHPASGPSPEPEPPTESLPQPKPLPKPDDDPAASIPRVEFGVPVHPIEPGDELVKRARDELPLPGPVFPKAPVPDVDPAPSPPPGPIVPPTFDPPAPQPLGLGAPKTLAAPNKD